MEVRVAWPQGSAKLARATRSAAIVPFLRQDGKLGWATSVVHIAAQREPFEQARMERAQHAVRSTQAEAVGRGFGAASPGPAACRGVQFKEFRRM
jgi:hypothetical protein